MGQFYHDAILVPPQDWPWGKYFSPLEFADKADGSVLVEPEFMERLYAARVILREPMIINRGFTATAEGSSHQNGFGADIKCHNSSYRIRLVSALLKADFNRIGDYTGHIHVDNDPGKDPNVMWVGVSK